MGQQLVLQTETEGDTATFTCAQPLGDLGGEMFASNDDVAAVPTPASLLSKRLFDADPAITNIAVLSDVVLVTRTDGWGDDTLAKATESLAGVSQVTVSNVDFDSDYLESLRSANYNATITSMKHVHESLWIFYVKPDGEFTKYDAGQYATLALGYWEPRVDGRYDEIPEDQLEKMVRRSYSISCSILDEQGELLDPAAEEALEFYVVLVDSPAHELPPVLTPRLFTKEVGDRIFLGKKAAGRYRLDKLTGDNSDVVFLATGTGEAPHNRMVLDLLRDGYPGKIVSVSTSRYLRDLAYLDTHKTLMERYDNYTYIPMTTREPENLGNKIYIQDFIKAGGFDDALGKELDPETLHIFLSGNPLMIGLPEWEGDTPEYPETEGVIEILMGRGFSVDRRGHAGNVHYEEYW